MRKAWSAEPARELTYSRLWRPRPWYLDITELTAAACSRMYLKVTMIGRAVQEMLLNTIWSRLKQFNEAVEFVKCACNLFQAWS